MLVNISTLVFWYQGDSQSLESFAFEPEFLLEWGQIWKVLMFFWARTQRELLEQEELEEVERKELGEMVKLVIDGELCVEWVCNDEKLVWVLLSSPVAINVDKCDYRWSILMKILWKRKNHWEIHIF
jgi:hypothetical protein